MSVQQEKIKAIIQKIWSLLPYPQPMSGNDIVNKIDEVYEQGELSGYNTGVTEGEIIEKQRFFKSYQRNGNRQDCNYMFAEWTEDIFTPVYDIRPTGRANNIFYNSFIERDLGMLLDTMNVNLDFSKTTSISYGFKYSNSNALPILDFSGIKEKSYHVFQYCDKLKRIDKIVISYGNQNNVVLNHAFDGCTELTDIIIEMIDKTDDNGIIQDIGFPDSHSLSKSSIENIIGLAHPLRAITITFSEQAVLKAYGSLDNVEWLSLIESVPKATIALV